MTTKVTLLAALAASFILVGCHTTPTREPAQSDFTGLPAAAFTITVVGTKGTPFKGTITTDGHVTTTGGTVPATFYISTHDLAVSLQKTGADGLIELRVAADGQGRGMSSTAKEFGGVRAQLICTPKVEQAMFTTF